MHAESGVNGVGTPTGAPTWPPCVAVSAGDAQVAGAHEPGVLGSQPTSGPGPQASTVPPPVTRQPACARAVSGHRSFASAFLPAAFSSAAAHFSARVAAAFTARTPVSRLKVTPTTPTSIRLIAPPLRLRRGRQIPLGRLASNGM